MEIKPNITVQERKEKIFAWMRANGHTYESLGKRLGVTGTGVSRMFTRSSIPTRRYKQLRDEGVTVFLVEQNANQALKIADRAYVLENGRVVMQGTGEQLLNDPKVRDAYLGG